MADFSALKTSIQNYIKQNGNEEITGNLLQQILLSMVSTLGDSAINDLVTALNAEIANRGNADTELDGRITTLQGVVNGIKANIENGYVYAGIATPSSTPASGKVFYLALTAGTYTNFGATVVPQGINILKYNGSAWSLDSFLGLDDAPTQGSSNLVKSGGVLDSIIKDGSAFDLSAYNNGTTYADLSAALTALNALPAAYKKGGMSMKFVLSSDNKYVQARLMTNIFTTSVNDWQVVDDEPVYGSRNLIKSGGVFGKVDFDSLIFGQSNAALNIIRKVSTNFDFKTLKLTGIYNRNAYSAEIYANVIFMSAVLDNDTSLQFMYTANQGGSISTSAETIMLSVTLGDFIYTINLDVNWAGIYCEKSLDVAIKKNEVNIINTVNPSFNANERGDEYVFGNDGIASNIIHSVKTNFSFAHLYLTGIFNRNAGSSIYAQVIFLKAVLADGTNINFTYTDGLEGTISSQKEEITITQNSYEIKLFVNWGGVIIDSQGEYEIKKSSVQINNLIGTTFKYAQIGDSITYMYDNKYETSYDDRGTTQTGYKGTGYGRLICEHFGIPYDNHYPQGLNGRTFSDYYIEWNRGNISFPNNINLWTIFLGTNDYMTSSGAREALGTSSDYINDTWTEGNLTVYGAIRKIVNKIRSQRTDDKQLRIVFITPFPLGVFCWGENEQQAMETFQAASFTKQNGEYVWVSRGNTGKEKTLKDVVDAIKWVCSYEHFKCISLFDVSLMDMAEINSAQTFENCGWTQQLYFAPSNFDFMRDGVHPNEKGQRIIGKRCIEELKDVFYDA